MATSKDVRDIMGMAAQPGGAAVAATKKKAPKPVIGKKITGISREILALHGDRPPPVAIVDSSKAYRKRFKRDFKPSHWEHAEFDNSARPDGLLLRHWRKQPIQAQRDKANDENGDAMDVDSEAQPNPTTTPYEFAKYNVQIDVPTYTDEQYNAYLQDKDWSREETDYLLDLVKEYYQKWPVIIDRYECQSSNQTSNPADPTAVAKLSDAKARDLEALKARYYFVSAKCMEFTFINGVADMNAEEFALHEQYTKFKPETERQRKNLAWQLCRRNPDDVKEEEYLLSELQRIMISAQKFEIERAELRQRLEIVPSPQNSKDRPIPSTSGELHALWQQLAQLDKSRKPRARISIDGSLQSPATGGLQTPASAGGHRDSISGSNQKRGSTSQQVPARLLNPRDELRFGVSTPTERTVSGVTFRTDKVLKLRQAKSQIQTQKIIQALTHLEIPDMLPLPTTRVVQAYEGLIQKINVLLDARKVLAKEQTELQTALAAKAEVEKKSSDSTKPEGAQTDADGDDDAEGEEDAEGEDLDVEMTDAPAATKPETEEAPRPSSSRSTRNNRSASILSAASSRGSRRKK